MKTTDLFKMNRSSKRLNESMFKTFGRKLNLETFTIEQLEDARNKLRTQIYTARSSSGFNENIENDTLTQAQWMHDAIVSELMDRNEPIVDNSVEEISVEAKYDPTDDDSHDYGTDLLVTIRRLYISARDGKDPSEQIKSLIRMKDGIGQSEEPRLQRSYDFLMKNLDGGAVTDPKMIMQIADKAHQLYHPSLEPIAQATREAVEEGGNFDEQELSDVLKKFDQDMNEIGGYGDPDFEKIMTALDNRDVESAIDIVWDAYSDQDGGELRNMDNYIQDLEDEFKFLIYSNPTQRVRPQKQESAPPTAKGERMVKHVKQGYAKDGKLTDKEKGIAYATAWKDHNKNESINTGEDMRNLREGEIQQASAIVTAKTMVDRVGRWIEELSGMENDTLLQLGDSIRDEMGQEQAKGFIEAVAPAIQAALENLKTTREALASGVRTLTGEEQPANMLGGEPTADMSAEPDAMNPDMGAEEPVGDEFGAAEPAAGGAEEAGREMRESINRQNRLLKVLAG